MEDNDSDKYSDKNKLSSFIENFFYGTSKNIIILITFKFGLAKFIGFCLCSISLIIVVIMGFPDEPTIAYQFTGQPLWLVALATFVFGGMFAGFGKAMKNLE
tara:strand:+ start:701 stop:1006 length:306 start_codon:yes stop_codon:yes gene_type:complete